MEVYAAEQNVLYFIQYLKMTQNSIVACRSKNKHQQVKFNHCWRTIHNLLENLSN